MDLSNAKEHYQSFTKKDKISKTIKNNYSATKNFWKPEHFLYNISYYRTSHKLSKIVRQAEKLVGSNSSSFSDTKKRKFFQQKNVKRTKW